MNHKSSVFMFEKAYDDLTTAVARAKWLCRQKNGHVRRNQRPATSDIPRLLRKRGRPKGSKTAKLPMPQAINDAVSAKPSASYIAENLCDCAVLSNDCSTHISRTMSSIFDESISRSQDGTASSISFESDWRSICLFCRMQTGVIVFRSSSNCEEGTVQEHRQDPECWALPLP